MSVITIKNIDEGQRDIQGTGTHLRAGVMPQITPVDLEFTMIKRVDELVSHRVLHVFLGQQGVLTDQDAILWVKAASGQAGTVVTLDGGGGEATAGKTEVFEHKDYDRT